jgi:hypothetical protein
LEQREEIRKRREERREKREGRKRKERNCVFYGFSAVFAPDYKRTYVT